MVPNPSRRFVLPSVAKYKAALLQIRENLSPNQLLMLKAQYYAKNYSLTSRQLAEVAGYKSPQGASLQYGRMGTLLREVLNYWKDDGQKSYILSRFIHPDNTDENEWEFVMHEQVIQALHELKWF